MFEKYVISPVIESLEIFRSRNAFLINGTFFSYGEVAEIISKIRSEIRETNISSRNIGLVTHDDIETYSAIIAIWLEGCGYVPVHPRYPSDRINEIFRQADVDLVVDSSRDTSLKNFRIINPRALIFEKLDLLPEAVQDNEIAYILFTSGSTGKPKGVPITRGNLGSFMKAFWEAGIMIDENDRCLQCFDLTFDVSVQSFLVPLSKGACVYTIPHGQIKPAYSYSLFEEHKLTFGAMAPSMVRFLRPYFDEINLPAIRNIILTAEASPLDLVEEWSKCIPNADIYDFYGPTEATIYCTCYKYLRGEKNKQLNGLLSIGKPLSRITIIIIDEEGDILKNHQKGELCISGDQITLGYWKNPHKNRTSFLNKEINGRNYRFYKTGDLCYIDDEGDIMYSGRIDFQVKIQGFRIELGEIEHHAREFLQGRNVAAIAFENFSGNNEIALFVEGKLSDKAGLSEYMKSKMPYYMVPSKIIEQNEFPLNSNGKIDRNILKKSIEK